MDDDKRRFGKNLVKARTLAGLTQEQLAEKADIERSYVQKIERGSNTPTVIVLSRLRKALKCSWDELLEGLE